MNYVKRIENVEKNFYNNDFKNTLRSLKKLSKTSRAENSLLYLLEAGVVLHENGEYKKSTEVFKKAEQIIESTGISVTSNIGSFLTNDRSKAYRAESYELVLVKLYIALNYALQNDVNSSVIYLRSLTHELKFAKGRDRIYFDNHLARYLHAILAESLNEYNDSRVQLKNLEQRKFTKEFADIQKYILAVKEQDFENIDKLKHIKRNKFAYNTKMKKVAYSRNMGELVILYHAGKSPIKESRGLLIDDDYFMVALHIALRIAIYSQSKQGITAAMIIAMLSTAENPVPLFRLREPKNPENLNITINSTITEQTEKYFDYTRAAVKNYNSQYKKIVDKNVSSLAVKLVIAYVATEAISSSMEDSKDNSATLLTRILGGIVAGATISALTKPDLRSWRLVPGNIQIKRFFLKPGKYSIDLKSTDSRLTKKSPINVTIESAKLKVISVRGLPFSN